MIEGHSRTGNNLAQRIVSGAICPATRWTHPCVFLRLTLGLLLLACLAPRVSHSGGVWQQQESGLPLFAGERAAVRVHLDQAWIDSHQIQFEELFQHGQIVFEARFNALDGQGRPRTTGSGAPREPTQPAFIRTSAPDANSCQGCHFQPRTGGAGEFASNVFVMAQERDPVVGNVTSQDSDERGSPALMGIGAIELLAREMSVELIAIREIASQRAKKSDVPVRLPLRAKGISFGTILVFPDGRVDPAGIDGVDWDLVVRPFHQKGAVVSIREFTNTALNHHHGMQTTERFGENADPDGDGKVNELTVGDVTALTVFQAALSIPGRLLPDDAFMRKAAERGERLFNQVGCAACHIPAIILDNPIFTEPGPFNPIGNYGRDGQTKRFAFDLTRDGPAPRLERLADGRAVVRAYTDLKRHDLNDNEYSHFANERISQGTLAGNATGASFTQPPLPRPTRQFLTRRLWDVGNTGPYGHRGDLTTLTEAIHFHGGEGRASRDAFFALPEADRATVIEFLNTLCVLPGASFLKAPPALASTRVPGQKNLSLASGDSACSSSCASARYTVSNPSVLQAIALTFLLCVFSGPSV